jgi:hypothetical protein
MGLHCCIDIIHSRVPCLVHAYYSLLWTVYLPFALGESLTFPCFLYVVDVRIELLSKRSWACKIFNVPVATVVVVRTGPTVVHAAVNSGVSLYVNVSLIDFFVNCYVIGQNHVKAVELHSIDAVTCIISQAIVVGVNHAVWHCVNARCVTQAHWNHEIYPSGA